MFVFTKKRSIPLCYNLEQLKNKIRWLLVLRPKPSKMFGKAEIQVAAITKNTGGHEEYQQVYRKHLIVDYCTRTEFVQFLCPIMFLCMLARVSYFWETKQYLSVVFNKCIFGPRTTIYFLLIVRKKGPQQGSIPTMKMSVLDRLQMTFAVIFL